MKKIYIKPYNSTIHIYQPDEYDKFLKATGATCQDVLAHTCGGHVWVSDLPVEDVGVCYHEASHVCDSILEDRLDTVIRNLADTTELRAYLMEYIGDEIRKYIFGW